VEEQQQQQEEEAMPPRPGSPEVDPNTRVAACSVWTLTLAQVRTFLSVCTEFFPARTYFGVSLPNVRLPALISTAPRFSSAFHHFLIIP
jgi:hypothetical protein